ncbi:MAG: S-layer homology domain-containing protein [Anaerocolumna sp.]
MRDKTLKNRGLNLLLVIAILATTILVPGVPAAAVSKIKIYNFIKLAVQATGLEVETTYLNAALKAGIVKDGDFSDYSKYTTRTDAAVILNQADEYLHGDTVDADLLSLILSSRISDIKKIDAGKREAAAKIYAKGFMKGYSNGYYIQSREFRGSEYMTAAGAKGVVAMLKNTQKRAKLSPDGQLIRTTNLPGNASKYEYILATYPNSFYEMKFGYQRATYSYEPVEGIDYASPAKVIGTMKGLNTGADGKCIYVDDWMDKVERNLKARLNVDYRTIDTAWLNDLRSTYFVFNDAVLDKDTTDDIKDYIKFVKKNKVVIKSSVIDVEPSTLYFDDGYWIRVYAKFKVSCSGDKLEQEDVFFGCNTIMLNNLKKDTWFTGVYEFRLGTSSVGSNGSDFAVKDDSLNDYFFKGEN